MEDLGADSMFPLIQRAMMLEGWMVNGTKNKFYTALYLRRLQYFHVLLSL